MHPQEGNWIIVHFREGDWGMWPILALLIAALVIIVERALYLKGAKIAKEQLLAQLKSQIMGGNVQGAIRMCESMPAAATRILRAGLMQWQKSDEAVQAAMDETALIELPKIEVRTGYLAMIGNLATLAGLLGTITGLIKAFAGVAGVDQSQKATLLAKGISEAMNCTAFGLATGIVALLFFAILNGQTQGVLDDIGEVKSSVANLLNTTKQAVR